MSNTQQLSKSSHCAKLANELGDLFARVRRYVGIISWTFVILETLAGLAFGALLGAHLSGGHYTGQLWALGVTYLVLLVVKVATQRLFPSAVVDELQSKQSLNDALKQLSRRDIVSRLITESITALNTQTCAIASDTGNDVCAQAVTEGLNQLLSSLIAGPQYLFNCNESRFTIVALVSYNDGSEEGWVEEFVVLRDDLDLKEMFTYDIMYTHEAKGSQLDLQKMLQRCINENVFVCDTCKVKEDGVAMAVSPIPLVCDTGLANGLLIFASPCGHSCPNDVDNTLRIFGRIVTNWLSKYSECSSAKGRARRYAEKMEELSHPIAASSPNEPTNTGDSVGKGDVSIDKEEEPAP